MRWCIFWVSSSTTPIVPGCVQYSSLYSQSNLTFLVCPDENLWRRPRHCPSPLCEIPNPRPNENWRPYSLPSHISGIISIVTTYCPSSASLSASLAWLCPPTDIDNPADPTSRVQGQERAAASQTTVLGGEVWESARGATGSTQQLED